MNIRKWVVGAALVSTMTVAFSLNVLANEEEVGFINTSNVRLRSESNLDANVLTTMNQGANLTILGKEGAWFRVIHNGSSGYVFNEFVTLGEAEQVEMNRNVEMIDWWNEGRTLMRMGSTATVTDVSTGIQFQIRIMSLGNHADVEPLTAADTAKMKQTRGGQWSWSPRAIWVTLENGRTIAASANAMPHGGGSIANNNFPGHFCIHLLNSRNHYNNRVDAGHQNQVRRAFDAS